MRKIFQPSFIKLFTNKSELKDLATGCDLKILSWLSFFTKSKPFILKRHRQPQRATV